jgi:Tol biopolymer transport system component
MPVRHKADGTGATWSPNSQRIAFSCQPDANKDDARQSSICLINSDGSNLIKLNYSGSFLTWSPDGRKIAFINQTQKRQNSIYVINADGSGLTQLTGQSK